MTTILPEAPTCLALVNGLARPRQAFAVNYLEPHPLGELIILKAGDDQGPVEVCHIVTNSAVWEAVFISAPSVIVTGPEETRKQFLAQATLIIQIDGRVVISKEPLARFLRTEDGHVNTEPWFDHKKVEIGELALFFGGFRACGLTSEPPKEPIPVNRLLQGIVILTPPIPLVSGLDLDGLQEFLRMRGPNQPLQAFSLGLVVITLLDQLPDSIDSEVITPQTHIGITAVTTARPPEDDLFRLLDAGTFRSWIAAHMLSPFPGYWRRYGFDSRSIFVLPHLGHLIIMITTRRASLTISKGLQVNSRELLSRSSIAAGRTSRSKGCQSWTQLKDP